MKNKPLISVIIPVYNGESFLPEAIESIRQQNYHPLEIIVVDDGSTDGTAKMVAGLAGNIRYIHQVNQGPAAARNTGIEAAQGEIIAFLDFDDLWPENKLNMQLAHLANNPTLDIILGQVQCMQLTGIIDDTPKFELFSKPFFTFLFGAILVRKSVFERIGLLDETLYSGEDVEWFMRVRENNIAMLVLKQVTLFYRLHQHNMSRFKDVRNSNFLKVLQKSLSRRRRQSNESSKSLPTLSDKFYK